VIPIRVSNILHSFATEAEVSALVEGMPGSKTGDRLWFRFPLDLRDQLSAGGEPFLAAFLPTAMVLGLPLSVEVPVDEEFLSGCQQIMSMYASWDRRLHRIEIRAPIAPVNKLGSCGTACFFTGGVDSFYSLIKNLDREHGENRVTHLIFIRGYANCPLENAQLFDGLLKNLERVALAVGLQLVVISTNLKSFLRAPAAGWDWYAGSLLVAPALCLAPMFRRVIIPSGDTYSTLSAWGSHPLVDPLWSTAGLQFLHDGCEASRSRKLEHYVTRSELALQHLRVCDHESRGLQNCGTCEKCLRTLIGLRALGIEPTPGVFAQSIDLRRVSQLDGGNRVIGYYLRDNLELVRRCRQSELEPFLLRALRNDPLRWIWRHSLVASQEIDRCLLNGRIRHWALSEAAHNGEQSTVRDAPIRWILSHCLRRVGLKTTPDVPNARKRDSRL
jgi:hypothetical protein